ncbi:hypothetical protein AB1282_19820 [Gottfriedia sp. S16(2024)]|uniref:hypothetical protein n=1 Tax=Gottfriedia sp. S16(2024) TaxID=3162883 RepID=UPI003D241D3F
MKKLLLYRICLTVVILVFGIWNYPSKLSSVAFFLAFIGLFFTLDVLRLKSKKNRE